MGVPVCAAACATVCGVWGRLAGIATVRGVWGRPACATLRGVCVAKMFFLHAASRKRNLFQKYNFSVTVRGVGHFDAIL